MRPSLSASDIPMLHRRAHLTSFDLDSTLHPMGIFRHEPRAESHSSMFLSSPSLVIIVVAILPLLGVVVGTIGIWLFRCARRGRRRRGGQAQFENAELPDTCLRQDPPQVSAELGVENEIPRLAEIDVAHRIQLPSAPILLCELPSTEMKDLPDTSVTHCELKDESTHRTQLEAGTSQPKVISDPKERRHCTRKPPSRWSLQSRPQALHLAM
jgi:hypothetical protein